MQSADELHGRSWSQNASCAQIHVFSVVCSQKQKSSSQSDVPHCSAGPPHTKSQGWLHVGVWANAGLPRLVITGTDHATAAPAPMRFPAGDPLVITQDLLVLLRHLVHLLPAVYRRLEGRVSGSATERASYER